MIRDRGSSLVAKPGTPRTDLALELEGLAESASNLPRSALAVFATRFEPLLTRHACRRRSSHLPSDYANA